MFLTETIYVRGTLVSGLADESKNRTPPGSIPVAPAVSIPFGFDSPLLSMLLLLFTERLLRGVRILC